MEFINMDSFYSSLNLGASVSNLYVPTIIAADEKELSSFRTTAMLGFNPTKSLNIVTIATLSTTILSSISPLGIIAPSFSLLKLIDTITGKKELKEARQSLLNMHKKLNKVYISYIDKKDEIVQNITNDIYQINKVKYIFKEGVLLAVSKKLEEMGVDNTIGSHQIEEINENILHLDSGLEEIIFRMNRLEQAMEHSDSLFAQVLDALLFNPIVAIYKNHKLANEIKNKVTEYEKEARLECKKIESDLVRIKIFEEALTNVMNIFNDIAENLIPLIINILKEIETKFQNNYEKIPPEILMALHVSCNILKGMSEKNILGNKRSQEATQKDVIKYSNELSQEYNKVKEEILKCEQSSKSGIESEEYDEDYECYNQCKPHLNIITLGNVDHGKTTLTSAITVVLAAKGLSELRSYYSVDNAPERNVNHVTFNAAYVKYETARRHYTHCDCPGNTDYVKLMIGGPQLDGGIVVCDIIDGPMKVTFEQIKLARQLNIPRLVVFVNKCDLEEDEEMLDVVATDMRELLSTFGYDAKRTPIIFGSALGALHGVEKWEDKIMALMKACDTWIPLPPRAIDKPFLMPIEDVFFITGRGSVATGCIETGVIHLGDDVQILGLGQNKKAVVTGVEMFRKLLDEGQAGDNVGLLLRGIDKNEIKRGMVLCKPSSIKPHSTFKATIYALKKEECNHNVSFYNNSHLIFSLRNMDYYGDILLEEGVRRIESGDNAEIKVNLTYPIALNVGLTFTIRENGHIVGIGKITELIS